MARKECQRIEQTGGTVQSDRVLYSVDEAAALLGISRGTVYALIDAGEIVSIKIGSRRVFYWDELNRWAREKYEDAARERATCEQRAENAVKRLKAL